MEENNRTCRRMEVKQKDKKWLSMVGFILSMGLLVIAIVLSVNQEKIDKLASTNEYYLANTTMSASSEISKSVNDILADKKIGGEPVIINNANENELGNTETIDEDKNNEEENIAKYIYDTEEVSSQKSYNENINETVENEENKQFIMPVNGEIYKEYAMDCLVYSDTLQEWVTHRGIDFQVNISDEVKASASGTVKAVKNDPRYGWSIIIEHKDGFSTIYTCLVDVSMVNEGDNVEQGQVIAKAGNSGVFEFADGSHLHFEMMKDGDYINPEMYIK